MFGFPPQYCRVIASRIQGDEAYVLLNTRLTEQAYLYGVNCQRENGTWFERGSSNASGWYQTDHDPDLGTLSLWDDAPRDADRVRIEFDGHTLEEPVVDRAYLVVWWRVPQPREWPVARAFRIDGRWIDSDAPIKIRNPLAP